MGIYTAKDETGNRYERLLVVKKSEKKGAAQWLVTCDCGTQKLVYGVNLRKGRVRSCGCLQKELASSRQSKAKGESLWNTVIYNYTTGAKKRNHEWKLSKDEAISLMKQNCYYCDEPPSNKKTTANGKDTILYSGIDRLYNNKGYTPDNCVPCCQVCNFAKRNSDMNEFLLWVKRVANFSLHKV